MLVSLKVDAKKVAYKILTFHVKKMKIKILNSSRLSGISRLFLFLSSLVSSNAFRDEIGLIAKGISTQLTNSSHNLHHIHSTVPFQELIY
jgi:hypothetical protein